MSTYDAGYDDGPRRYHSVRTRQRDRDDPDYMREDIYIERGKAVGGGARGGELVFRDRDREESIEEISRDFPPPGRDGIRRARSTGGGRGRYEDDYHEEDRRSEYTTGTRRQRDSDRDRRRNRRDDDYYSDGSESPRPRERRKSGVGEALESLGLGGVAGAFLGSKKDKEDDRRSVRSARSRSRGARSRRDHSSDDGRSRAGNNRKDTERKWAQSAQAALIAGAVEAFRVRKEPGAWTGDKGKRIATAALASGAIDGFIDRDPNTKHKRHLAEAVIGGLVANRLANGARSKSRGPNSRNISPDGFRSRSRSRSRSVIDRFRGRSQSRGRSIDDRDRDGGGNGGAKGAVTGLVAGGALAAGAKAIYDRMRSKSRKRRSPSNSSADSYVPSRNRRRDRRRSPPSDMDTRQIGGATDRSLARGTNRGGGGSVAGGGGGMRSRAIGAGAGAGAAVEGERAKGSNNGDSNDSSSSSTTGMEQKRKKMRGKELITAGLATVATIHAAHSVYNSMQGHEKRHRLVAEGEMSVEEARKKQTKAWIQDAAAVGIAALGIKGAFSEWKEMNEHRHEIHELEKRRRDRHKKRIARQKKEERERQERMLAIMEKNPQFAMGYNMQGGNVPMPTPYGSGGPAAEQSGNPYASR